MRKLLLHFPVDNMPHKMPAKYGGQKQKTEFVTNKTVLAKKLTVQKCTKFALLKKVSQNFLIAYATSLDGFPVGLHTQLNACKARASNSR